MHNSVARIHAKYFGCDRQCEGVKKACDNTEGSTMSKQVKIIRASVGEREREQQITKVANE